MSVVQRHVVSVLPVAFDGRVLLQQRDDKPGIPCPGAWTLFGGTVEPGETPAEAIVREVCEELDITLPMRYWHTYSCPVRSIAGELDVRVHVFVGELTQPVEALTLYEGQAMALYDAEAAQELELGFGKTPVLRRFFAQYPALELHAMDESERMIAQEHGIGALRAMFEAARAQGRAAFLPYFPIGFPDYNASIAAIRAMAAAGVDGFEIGIPFSDPLADGPIIQAATQKALENGITVRACLDAVHGLRAEGVAQPMLMMGYLNPLIAYGLERFVADAKAAGADGLIVPDLPPEEAIALIELCEQADMALIFFLAPTSSPERVALVAQRARGFIYVVSLTGVTGARDQLSDDLPAFIERVRVQTGDIPLVMGFGISTPEQAQRVSALVDGLIVGSALVRAGGQGVDAVEALARDIRAALDAPSA